MKIIRDPVSELLQRSMSTLSLRQQMTLHNIANIDTPGYKAKEVPFQHELRRAMPPELPMAVTHHAHLSEKAPSWAPRAIESRGTAVRNDGNNVDIERELSGLAETTLLYSALARQINGRINSLRRVITEGRG